MSMGQRKPKVLVIDTYYQPVIDKLTDALLREGDGVKYEHALANALDLQFGTGDSYSHYLREFGWEVQDVIANFPTLQNLWAIEHGMSGAPPENVMMAQIEAFRPDVLFLQNLSVLGKAIDWAKDYYLIAGQVSCAIRRELIPNFRVLFTSFPHYLTRFSAQPHCKFVYNPLAFDPRVLDGISTTLPRDIDIAFVGGVGAPSHWAKGLDVLTAVARAFPTQFKWWGYGVETVTDPTLRACHQGLAWGRGMYRIYSRAKIVINRHGEIAQGYSNNMRLYEATGCGAYTFTELSKNVWELFNPDEIGVYGTTDGLIRELRRLLQPEFAEELAETARNGQRRTHAQHSYHERMKLVSDTLMEMMS